MKIEFNDLLEAIVIFWIVFIFILALNAAGAIK